MLEVFALFSSSLASNIAMVDYRQLILDTMVVERMEDSPCLDLYEAKAVMLALDEASYETLSDNFDQR
jgi:hypothetical protein